MRENSSICALKIMTKKRESEGGNPPSGRENPELPCLVLFTPRNNRYENIRREKTRIVG
jgi:hypothetical protein